MRDGQTLDSLYYERAKLYEKYADITIDEAENSLEDVVSQVADSVMFSS